MAMAEQDAGEILVQVGGLQNKAWAQDTSKFGYKMLTKMGWKAGEGLGKASDGQVTHVHIKKRSENLGLGCSLKQVEVEGWSNTSQGFKEVLSALNASYGSSTTTTSKKPKKEKKAKKEKKKRKLAKAKDKKAKSSTTVALQRRILYHKRISNKNAKSYSAQDLSAILGHATS